MIKQCEYCGKEFEAKTVRRKFCSDACRQREHRGSHPQKGKTEEQKRRYRERQREKYAREHHIGEKRICVICGSEFISKSEKGQTCSKQCSRILSRRKTGFCNSYLITKTCIVCGGTFETYRIRQITCSKECSDARNKERRKYGTERRYPLTRDEWLAKVKSEKAERDKEKQLIKARIDLIRHINAYGVSKIPRECACCGEVFYDQHPAKKYCSDVCKRRMARSCRKDKRITKEMIVDTDITLKKLFIRDGGKCWLCGGDCDWDDWATSVTGNKYPGDAYPTKDHVIPIARGGLEAWENVRLAHWKCNLQKSDNLYPHEPMSRDEACVYKRNGNQPKKTAQYTMDGELVRVWESTGAIRRQLGLNNKKIQDVCRGERKSAFGFRWAYIEEAANG